MFRGDVRLLTGAFAALASVIAWVVHTTAPDPYMDEIFHVPQTQRYCAGDWRTWDPKITTFPGLYLLGAAAGWAAQAVQRWAATGGPLPACTASQLRAVNVALATAAVPVFYRLAAALDSTRTRQQLALLAAVCVLCPLHFFYSFLYYTDVASTLFTLAAWLAALHRRFLLAGALGAAAVLMRQTNAVWVAFILAWAVLDACQLDGAPVKEKGYDRPSKDLASATGEGFSMLVHDVSLLARRVWVLRWRLLGQLWPLAAVVLSFACFLVWNGGVVVGDKANHVPVRHFMQPLYFCLYCTTCLAPLFWTLNALLSAGAALRRGLQRRPAAAAAGLVAATAGVAVAVAQGTLVHPFLLADNRHYTFYLWRRVFGRTPWARYALTPTYLHSMWAMQQRLAHRHPLRTLLLAGASAVVLVPAHLVELRYFTLPFIVFVLLARTPSEWELAAVAAGLAALNAGTLWIFLFKPFAWTDDSVARFLW